MENQRPCGQVSGNHREGHGPSQSLCRPALHSAHCSAQPLCKPLVIQVSCYHSVSGNFPLLPNPSALRFFPPLAERLGLGLYLPQDLDRANLRQGLGGGWAWGQMDVSAAHGTGPKQERLGDHMSEPLPPNLQNGIRTSPVQREEAVTLSLYLCKVVGIIA